MDGRRLFLVLATAAFTLLSPCTKFGFALDPDQGWKLFSAAESRGAKAGGWLNAGIMFNTDNNRTSRNDPTPFSNPAGEFQFNQTWLYYETPQYHHASGFTFGARIDALFGTDGPDTQAFGDGSWDFGWNPGGEYGTAIPQLYGEVGYNDVSVKLGHFYTILGYEVVPAPGNFFYSHAYGMTYGEPFTHTGALAEYQHNDYTTLYAGYTLGWDSSFENRGSASTALGGATFELTEDISTTYAFTWGRYGNGIGPSGNLGDIYSHTILLKVLLTENLEYVLLNDLAVNYGLGGPVGNAEWYGITNYLFYTFNDRLKGGFRFEWFDDADGLRIATVNDGLNDLHYFGFTLGLNWSPCENFVIRPEFRADMATSHSDGDFNDVFSNNTRDHLELFGCDFILTF